MKYLNLFALAVVVLLVSSVSAFAAEGTTILAGTGFGAGIGAALTMIGASYGFGKIGSAALESMARQPEVAGSVSTSMLIIAALLEGATFFALFVCYTLAGKVPVV